MVAGRVGALPAVPRLHQLGRKVPKGFDMAISPYTRSHCARYSRLWRVQRRTLAPVRLAMFRSHALSECLSRPASSVLQNDFARQCISVSHCDCSSVLFELPTGNSPARNCRHCRSGQSQDQESAGALHRLENSKSPLAKQDIRKFPAHRIVGSQDFWDYGTSPTSRATRNIPAFLMQQAKEISYG